jgi:uncharacterized membrane protein YeaQ/YmgE (transglycosylase-associated protein family)
MATQYLWMFVVGLVVGLIARFIMPGSEQLGLLMTGILGILGSFVGGAIARVFSKPADGALVHPAGLMLSDEAANDEAATASEPML